MRRGKNRGKGSLLSEIMLWISLERLSVFGLAWRLADDRGRWSWKRVINKHFNRAGERCQQAMDLRRALWRPSRSHYKSKVPHTITVLSAYVCVTERGKQSRDLRRWSVCVAIAANT